MVQQWLRRGGGGIASLGLSFLSSWAGLLLLPSVVVILIGKKGGRHEVVGRRVVEEADQDVTGRIEHGATARGWYVPRVAATTATATASVPQSVSRFHQGFQGPQQVHRGFMQRVGRRGSIRHVDRCGGWFVVKVVGGGLGLGHDVQARGQGMGRLFQDRFGQRIVVVVLVVLVLVLDQGGCHAQDKGHRLPDAFPCGTGPRGKFGLV